MSDAAPPPTDLLALPPAGLGALAASLGHKRFRGKQIHDWLFKKGAQDVDEMRNLPKDLRARLRDASTIGTLTLATEQVSADGTTKRLYRLADGQLVETVLMRYRDGRNTACISSQAGCAMGCVFCATGQMGFARHLRTEEILEQVWRFDRELKAEGSRLSNVVMMGMGEPFHNYEAAVQAMRRINTEVGIGARHITVSTVGLVPAIRRFAEEGLQVTLAISLHSTDDRRRSAMMPVNKRWPVEELVAACRDYVEKTRRRVTFEWALIGGLTDSLDEATRLGRLLRGLLCHVNVIPLNPTEGYEGQPSHPEDVDAFVARLNELGVPASVRVRRGIDIDAGCGQLKSAVLKRQRGA
jgi:23S rRNA (adenine2503-C2)-methyltransferase